MDRIITVNGKGGVHVVPDITRLVIRIDMRAQNYTEAYEAAKDNLAMIVKILEYNKLPGNLGKTIRLDISEHLESVLDEYGHHIKYKKKGYDLDQHIRIDLGTDNVLVNKIVRGVGKFISNAQINIGYTVRDARPYQLKMLERAVKDAREKAHIMADALGCALGRVVNIDYSDMELHIFSQAREFHNTAEAMASKPEALDITPEDLEFSDEVRVQWELAGQ